MTVKGNLTKTVKIKLPLLTRNLLFEVFLGINKRGLDAKRRERPVAYDSLHNLIVRGKTRNLKINRVYNGKEKYR